MRQITQELAVARDHLANVAPDLLGLLDRALDDAHAHGRTSPGNDMPTSEAEYRLVMAMLGYVDAGRAGAKAFQTLQRVREVACVG